MLCRSGKLPRPTLLPPAATRASVKTRRGLLPGESCVCRDRRVLSIWLPAGTGREELEEPAGSLLDGGPVSGGETLVDFEIPAVVFSIVQTAQLFQGLGKVVDDKAVPIGQQLVSEDGDLPSGEVELEAVDKCRIMVGRRQFLEEVGVPRCGFESPPLFFHTYLLLSSTLQMLSCRIFYGHARSLSTPEDYGYSPITLVPLPCSSGLSPS